MQQLLEFLSLSDPNVRYVVLGMILLGASSGVVGCFTFLRKRALLGDAIAHSVLPGVCLAFMFWGTKNPIVLLIGALITGWLSLVLIDWITSKSRIKSDAAIGLTLSVFFGIGIMLLTSIQQSGNAAQSGLEEFLFGKAASMLSTDVLIFGILSVVLIATIMLFYKPFSLIAFDEEFAHAIGLPVRTYELILSVVTVLAVAIGIQAVGVVLMAAMLVTPATAARFWTDKLWLMLILAAIFGSFSGVLGAYISSLSSSMPTGPWVVVILSLIAIGSLLFTPEKGIFARYFIRRNYRLKMLEENILKIFFQLGEKQKEFFNPQALTALQARREMPNKQLSKGLKRLLKKDYLHAFGSDWVLTEIGKLEAQRVVRIHRLWEVYLTEHLRIAPDHVHDDAEAIEHLITPELEKQLEQLLNYPATDPHDSDIPYQ